MWPTDEYSMVFRKSQKELGTIHKRFIFVTHALYLTFLV